MSSEMNAVEYMHDIDTTYGLHKEWIFFTRSARRCYTTKLKSITATALRVVLLEVNYIIIVIDMR